MVSTREGWKRHIEKQSRSGLSKAEYCRRNGIDDKRFFYWQRRLGKQTEPRFVELQGEDSQRLEIEIGGVILRVPVGYDEGELKRVVEALRC